MKDERTEEKEVEVIAEKSRKAAYAFLAMAVFGVVVAAAGVILYLTRGYKTIDAGVQAAVISLTAVGAVLIIVFTALFIKQLYSPFVLIKLNKGEIIFPDGKAVKPSEITAVERDKKAGKITVILSGEKIEVGGVGNCEKAYRKLCVLTGNPIEE